MTKHVLSKSTFIRGLQCHKSLYLYKHYYHLKDPVSEELQTVFNRGHEVGILAQKLFPGGVDASPSSRFKYAESVERTRELIANGQEVIYEAAFQVEEVLVLMDILVKRNGKWFAYEVKSSTKVSETYILDAAVQYYVITNSGIELEDVSVVHINNQYVLKGDLELEKLFKKVSVKDKILELQTEIGSQIHKLKQVVFGKSIPKVEIGKHCFLPYQCDYMGYCWKNNKDAEIFSLAGMGKEGQFELYESGFRNFDDIENTSELSKHQQVQVAGKKIIEQVSLSTFLNKFKFPLWFLDFETVQYAVPKYQGTKPYQQIPFQFSLHKLEINGDIKHYEFLGEPGFDPRKDFAKEMFNAIGEEGSVVVYNATFEKMILGYVANWFPEYSTLCNDVVKRMIDLMKPFQQKDYYLPEMKGSHSIKAVLPALVPEMSYDELEVNNGHKAATVYNNLQYTSDMFEIEEIKHQLRDYCKLDTLAMVKIYEKLVEVVI